MVGGPRSASGVLELSRAGAPCLEHREQVHHRGEDGAHVAQKDARAESRRAPGTRLDRPEGLAVYDLPVGGDLNLEEFRSRADMWAYARHARRFLEANTPFWLMAPADELLSGEAEAYGGGAVSYTHLTLPTSDLV